MAEQRPTRGGGTAHDAVQESLPLAGPASLDIPPFSTALLALAEVPGVGQRALYALVNAYGEDLGRLLISPPEQTIVQLRKLRAPKALIEHLPHMHSDMLNRAAEQQDQLAKQNIHLLGPTQLPPRLAQRSDGPRWLFVQGDPSALSDGPHVAVVGTREATAAGIDATSAAVRTMAPYPITLVSGLANGVDAQAHARALDYGLRNVAFIGHGINVVFPAETAGLRERIIERGGAVATEYLPDDRYRKQQFVQRNRLQASLAETVIATEGQSSGGTAHTVRFASRYRTPVIGLAWPGAGSLTELVSGTPDGRLIEIFTPSGRRQLDSLLRELAEQHGHSTCALALVERQLAWEVDQRDLRREDLLHLQNRIHHLFNEKL